MPSYAPHPLEAKFIKLALLQHVVTPVQVKRCQETLQQRAARGQTGLSVEQLLQEEGLITEDECEELWVQIAQAGDTKVRDQLQDKLGTRPVHANAEKTTVRRPEHPEKVPKRLGDYELIEPIGRGGMGAVYKARQIQMERYVALKLLPPELASNAKYIRRFIREARSAGMLNQGNLVHVHDVGAVDGRYFISMELVEGLTIKQLMRREGRVGVLETLKIAEQVCAALECAHRHKIVHRDIKPDNIMLTPQGIAKLCDLGLAKVLEGGPLQDTDTQEGHAMGTPHYMSPEQARSSGKVDARSDLYSLGATVYHMLTGRVPFDGDTPIEVLMRVTNEAPPRPDRFEPLLPPPLTALIMRLLAKNPDERPASAEVLRKEFHQLRRDLETGRIFVFDDIPLGLKFGKPVPAPPPLPPFRWRWAAGAGAAAVFLLLAGVSRLNRSQAVTPEVEYAAFEAARKPPEQPELHIPLQPATPHQATRSVPLQVALDPASRRNLESALQASPQLWPRVLAALETLDPAELAATPADEQAGWAALKARTLKLRDHAVEVELSQRRRGAVVLAGAGLYQRAGELLADLPPALRGAAQTRLQAELDDLTEQSRLDAERQTRELDALLRAGLTRVALNRCERWSREHDTDGVKPGAAGMQQARNAQRRMAEEVRQAHRKALENEEVQVRALDAAVAAVARVRQLSSKHDLAGARKEAERLVADSNGEAERLALAFEIERIKRVEALYARVAAAVNERPGRIKESDFRTDAKVSGRVKSLDETHFVVIADPGIQAIVPLAHVTRGEIRTLIAHALIKEELAPDDLLGRLAFDLEERNDTAIRLLLIDLAAKDEGAAALLNRLLAGDAPWLRHQARALLARAEDKFIEGRYGESQRLTAAALSSIGSAGDGPLESRAQALLELCAASRAAANALKPTAGIVLPRDRLKVFYASSDLAGRNSDWTWQGAQPELGGETGLAFGAEESRGTPAWKLEAPGGIELDMAEPFEGAGALKLLVCPDGAAAQTWTLALDAGLDGCTASFRQGHEPAAPWAQTALALGRHHRVWLRFEVGLLRWGVNDRELGQQGAGPEPVWKFELRGAGPFKLRGVSAEGRLLAPRTGEDRARDGLAAYTAAMLKTGDDRALELRGLLTDHGADAPLASRICAALADCYRSLDRGADCRYWESRALFECPQERWPAETRALLAGHRLWLHARDRLGPAATDALRFGRVDAYNQPNITMGGQEAPREKNGLVPEPEQEPQTPGARQQAGTDKNKDSVRRVVVRITSGGNLVEEYKEPAVGLERPRQP